MTLYHMYVIASVVVLVLRAEAFWPYSVKTTKRFGLVLLDIDGSYQCLQSPREVEIDRVSRAWKKLAFSTAAATALARRAEAAGGGGTVNVRDASEFRERYPFVEPKDFIPYLRAEAKEGDFDSVVRAMDRFAEVYPMYKLSNEKVSFLAKQVCVCHGYHIDGSYRVMHWRAPVF